MVLSKREGLLLPGPGLVWSLWSLFFLQLWLLYFLLSWSFFGRYLGCSFVPGQGLDSCVVVWFLFLLLFWLAFSLLSWLLFWSLLSCSWGPGTRIGSCMVISIPLSYDFGCYFLHLMKHGYCQTFLTFQYVISSLRVYAFAILNKVRSRYVKDLDCLAAWLPAGITTPLFLPCHRFEFSACEWPSLT